MSHMVIFQTPEGDQGYNQFETVEESVAFVEKLRNDQNVLNARIFKLTEVKFEFRPYYKVQLAQLDAGSQPPSWGAPVAESPIAEPPRAEAPAAEAATGEVRLGSVTLGEAPSEPPAPGLSDPSAPANLDSPVGAGNPAPNGTSFVAASGEEERGRRGLFGR